MYDLSAYLPQDRRLALARGETLPERTSGTAVFADISGFTPLTEELTNRLGARRGIEELILRINGVYDALIGEVDRFGGSVISFSGDAITCWFDAGTGRATLRAVMCAQGMQSVMRGFPSLALKIAVSTGVVRRFATGDPGIRLMDAIAGSTIARLATAEHIARAGEILLDETTKARLQFPAREVRVAVGGESFCVLDPSFHGSEPDFILPDPGDGIPGAQLDMDVLKRWILPIVYERESAGHGLLLTELRPTAALFVRFMGIDYDDDPQAREKLGAVVSIVQHVVERHEGSVLDLTIGDKGSYAYACFGASHVHEDDARRAVQSALEIRQDLGGLAFLDSMQFGLSSGTMRVGVYGSSTRRSFGAFGDEVNLAARLMMTAAPGEILMSQRIRKAIADEFLVEARPAVAMKGRADPVPVFAVLGLQQHRALRLQEPAYTLPLVGRTAETRLLEEKMTLALSGQGQVIGITAEAGMGKSRLVAECIRLAWRHHLTAYGGACRSGGLNTSYFVWQELWSAIFNLDSSMPTRKQLRALEGELRDRAPEHVDALPLIAAVLGLPAPDNEFTRALEPKDRKTQVETVLIECLQSAAREAFEEGGALLLVLEDLHWVDAVSFDLLQLAAQAIEKLPVLILLTYRPPVVEPFRSTLARLETLNHFIQLRLAELNPVETEQAIHAKLAQLFPERGGAVPQLLITRITSRAQGNPFYVEELLNYLHDRGMDPRDASALDSLELPASLHSLVLSRIDQLTASQQLSLKVASIIGRIFRFVDLRSYYASLGTEEQLRSDLQELARLDLTPLESPEPELTYLFKHLVTHEVAYESLAYSTRAQLHGEYARYLEASYPERIGQLAPQLAHHFERAQDQIKAREYLLQAGEQAAANYANDEALGYFDRTLALTPETETRARFDTLLKRERIYDLLGKREEQRQDLAALARLADHLDETSFPRALIATRQAHMEIDVGDYAAARASARAAVSEIETDASTRARAPELLVDAYLLEARAMFLSGETAAAAAHLDTALSLAREVAYIRGEYNALAQLGTASWSAGDYAAATRMMEQSLDLVQEAGDLRRELEILNNLGIVSKATSRFPEAIGFYERAQKIARKIGDRVGEATLLNNMGSASLAFGDFVRAGIYSEQAAAIAADVKDPALQGMALTNRGEVYRELGQYVPARATAERALTLIRATGYRRGEAILLDNIGLIEFASNHYGPASEATRQAIAIAHEIGSRPIEAGALGHLGLIYIKAGQIESAEKAIMDAGRLAEELAEPNQLLEVRAARATLALARGGMKNIERARSEMEELTHEILREPATERSHVLPLWMHLTCIRVMQARGDPDAGQLIARTVAELQARSERIADPDLRKTYLNVTEHRTIMAIADASISAAG